MQSEKIGLQKKSAEGYVVPLGPANLVWAQTDTGLVGCGAFDVAALDKFNYPAAKISGVATVQDLLGGKIKEANQSAQKRGITAGMTGREALEKL